MIEKRIPWQQGKEYPLIIMGEWEKGGVAACFRARAAGPCLNEQAGYYDAKKRGDIGAGRRIVDGFLTSDVLADIHTLTRDKNPLIVAPSVTSKGQHNVLPISLAHHIATHLGLTVNKQIFQKKREHRTGQDGIDRLYNQPGFYGNVQRGQNYLLVDDVVTLGGTLAGLRSHIEANGGNVIGTVALAHSFRKNAEYDVHRLGSGAMLVNLAITPEQEQRVRLKLRTDLGRKPTTTTVLVPTKMFREALGFGTESLTTYEAGFIENIPDAWRIFERAPA